MSRPERGGLPPFPAGADTVDLTGTACHTANLNR